MEEMTKRLKCLSVFLSVRRYVGVCLMFTCCQLNKSGVALKFATSVRTRLTFDTFTPSFIVRKSGTNQYTDKYRQTHIDI